jgi:thioesterase domain-containing protein
MGIFSCARGVSEDLWPRDFLVHFCSRLGHGLASENWSPPVMEMASGKRDKLPSRILSEAGTGPTTEEQIITVYEDISPVSGVRVNDDLFEFDDDIDRAIAFVGRINERFDRSFGLSVLSNARTPEALASLIDNAGEDEPTTAARVVSGAPSLFCFAASEEDVFDFANLRRLLDPAMQVYAVLPRLSLQRPGEWALSGQIAQHVEFVRAVHGSAPVHLLGEGIGGILAYEVAQQLLASGIRVVTLALVDTTGPDAVRLVPTWKVLLKRRIQEINVEITQRLYHRHSLSRGRPGRSGLLRRLRSFSARRTKSAGEASLRINMLKTEMFMRRAIAHHALSPYPGRVIIFRSSRSTPFLESDFTLGWRGLFPNGGLTVRVIPSYHGSMIKQPFVRFLAPELEAVLRNTG